MEDDGHNPDEYEFETSYVGGTGTPKQSRSKYTKYLVFGSMEELEGEWVSMAERLSTETDEFKHKYPEDQVLKWWTLVGIDWIDIFLICLWMEKVLSNHSHYNATTSNLVW